MIDSVLATGAVPDFILRKGIQKLVRKRLNDEYTGANENSDLKRKELIEELRNSPVAIETDKANDQHYMVPPAFFSKMSWTKIEI